MKLFNGQQFVTLFSLLGKTVIVAQRDDPNHVIREDTAQRIAGAVKEIKGLCEELGLSTSALKASVVLNRVKPGFTANTLATSFDSLSEFIALEMTSHLFMYIEPSKAHYYSNIDLFGSEVSEKFPSAKDDVAEAGKCLALNRGTACVFHLMRVLESGLYALADALQIPKIEENWHNAIEQIEKAIRKLPSQTLEQKNDSAFYSEAATYFFNVKGPWRNRSAHSGQIYTEEKAEQVFNSVRGFMQVLATRLKQKSL